MKQKPLSFVFDLRSANFHRSPLKKPRQSKTKDIAQPPRCFEFRARTGGAYSQAGAAPVTWMGMLPRVDQPHRRCRLVSSGKHGGCRSRKCRRTRPLRVGHGGGVILGEERKVPRVEICHLTCFVAHASGVEQFCKKVRAAGIAECAVPVPCCPVCEPVTHEVSTRSGS